MIKLSIVVPVYLSEGSLPELYDRLRHNIEPLGVDFELIMVDDGSPDASWKVIASLAAMDERVKGIHLSRNFGQHYAISCGLDHATGNWVVVMDCDLQDRPEDVQALYSKALEGFDIVCARRRNRTDGVFKKCSSYVYKKLLGWLIGSPLDPSLTNFSIVSRSVADEVRRFREGNRSYPLFLKWLGFKTGYVDVAHGERFVGKSAYTFGRLVEFAVRAAVAQSNRPLLLSIRFGIALSLCSLLYGLWLVIRYFLYDIGVQGWTSVMVSLFVLSGLLLFHLGIIGLYLGQVYDEVKARPLYVVRESVNLSSDIGTLTPRFSSSADSLRERRHGESPPSNPAAR